MSFMVTHSPAPAFTRGAFFLALFSWRNAPSRGRGTFVVSQVLPWIAFLFLIWQSLPRGFVFRLDFLPVSLSSYFVSFKFGLRIGGLRHRHCNDYQDNENSHAHS